MELTKGILVVALLLGFTNATKAGDNKVYIDQSGDRGTISITQDGAGNIVRGQGAALDQSAKMYGDDSTVTISQQGSGNSLTFGMVAGSQGSQNTFTYSVTGNNATANIDCNNAAADKCDKNVISVTQAGNSSAADIRVKGANNTVTANTSGGPTNSVMVKAYGDMITSITAVTGSSNSVNVETSPTAGTAAVANTTIMGAGNSTSITQSGGAVTGHSATLAVTGNGNTVTFSQTGTLGDNTAVAQMNGNNNTLTLNQMAR